MIIPINMAITAFSDITRPAMWMIPCKPSQWRRQNADRPIRFTSELPAAVTPASSKVDFRVDRRSSRSPDCFRQETWTCRPKKCRGSWMQCDFTCSETQLYIMILYSMSLCSFVVRKNILQREMWHAMNEMTLFGMQQHSVIWCIYVYKLK